MLPSRMAVARLLSRDRGETNEEPPMGLEPMSVKEIDTRNVTATAGVACVIRAGYALGRAGLALAFEFEPAICCVSVAIVLPR